MEDTFSEHLSGFINKVVTIYVEGGLKTGFSGFVLDVNMNCVTLLSLKSFDTLKNNKEEIFIPKTIIVISVDKIVALVSYMKQNPGVPFQDLYHEENSIRSNTPSNSSSPLIVALLAFLLLEMFK